jgi:hypothetical protein
MSQTDSMPPLVQQLMPVFAGVGSFAALTVVGVTALDEPLIGAAAGLFTGFGTYHTLGFVLGQSGDDTTPEEPAVQTAAAATAIEPVGIILFAAYLVTEDVTRAVQYTLAAAVVVVPVFFFVSRWMFGEMTSSD